MCKMELIFLKNASNRNFLKYLKKKRVFALIFGLKSFFKLNLNVKTIDVEKISFQNDQKETNKDGLDNTVNQRYCYNCHFTKSCQYIRMLCVLVSFSQMS